MRELVSVLPDDSASTWLIAKSSALPPVGRLLREYQVRDGTGATNWPQLSESFGEGPIFAVLKVLVLVQVCVLGCGSCCLCALVVGGEGNNTKRESKVNIHGVLHGGPERTRSTT
jgi:hypothetical protein